MTQEFVTLPREIVEQAIYALYCTDSQEGSPAYNLELKAIKELRAALEQSQGEQEPVAEHDLKDVRCECCGYMTHHREHMGCIRAAHTKREPPTTEQSSAVQQPQGEQEPVGEVGSMPGTIVFTMACFHASDAPVGTKLYTRPQNLRCKSTQARLATLWGYEKPQPAQKPLTDEQVLKAVRHLYQSDLPVGMGFSDDLDVARAIEAAHNIK